MVLPDHVHKMAYPVLRHRIILTHEAESWALILMLSLIKYFIVSPYWNKPDEEEDKALLQRLIGNFFDGTFPAI